MMRSTSARPNLESPPAAGSEERPLAEESATPALARAKRNGYATVIARVLDHLTATPPQFAQPPRTALLSRVDERRLKDADESQLGAVGLALAEKRSKDEWRAFLTDHFRRRYDLVLLFDSARTRIS
jgi:hypothetical protein